MHVRYVHPIDAANHARRMLHSEPAPYKMTTYHISQPQSANNAQAFSIT